MNKIDIKRGNFEKALSRLKEFSDKANVEVNIKTVQTSGDFFGFGDHKVTGYELNSRIESIQECFIDINKTNNEVIKEFREVYNALIELDKEYITKILSNVKAVEKTSNDIRKQQEILEQHNKRLDNQQGKLGAHQKEIEKNVESIEKIINVLKNFKEKLERYEHLKDIDKTWNDCKIIKNEIKEVSENIIKFSNKVEGDVSIVKNKNKELSERVNKNISIFKDEIKTLEKFLFDSYENIESKVKKLENQIFVIREMESFIKKLKKINHLSDIDFMWNNIKDYTTKFTMYEKKSAKFADTIQKNKDEIKTLEKFLFDSYENIEFRVKELENQISVIREMEFFIGKLKKINHLDDIDFMWDNIEEYISKFAIYEKKIIELDNTIQKNKEEVNENIEEVVKTINTSIEILTKKIKYVYWITGGLGIIVILELILLFMRGI